jgi:competence protein ComEA
MRRERRTLSPSAAISQRTTEGETMKIVNTIVASLLALISAAAFAAVDVNKANQAELEAVKGIGPSMSTRIIDARKAGSFKDWSDLQTRVKGVGSAKSAKLSAEGLTVGGAEFKSTDGAARTAKVPKAGKPAKADGAKNATK